MPLRCKNFNGYPDRRPTVQTSTLETPKSPAPDAPPADPLIVEIYTPSGTPMTIRTDSAGHAAWLRQMNPKPTNPMSKPHGFEIDVDVSCMVSESEHNAHGRYFKFLATWPDGSQCYLCQMSRQTIDEMRAQHPSAANIQPIENEEPK